MADELIRTTNLRDLGGFGTGDGGTVRRGRVFRSAALSDLAGSALEAVRGLGIRTIVDLRRNGERNALLTPWQALGCADYWARDYDYSDADHRERMRGRDLTAEDSRAQMIALYAELPYDQSEAYARVFRAIAAGEGPVLFHCAVGKDRTGVAAALILSAVGVARDAILADYIATERFDLLNSPHARLWPPRSEARAAAFAPLLGVDPAYLDAMFDALEARGGTIEAYARDVLGLDQATQGAVRRNLVEPNPQ
jgi:protein-tyrosine phosphatase